MISVRILQTLFLFQLRSILGDDNNHRYNIGDAVSLWVNSVGPYNNPQVLKEIVIHLMYLIFFHGFNIGNVSVLPATFLQTCAWY